MVSLSTKCLLHLCYTLFDDFLDSSSLFKLVQVSLPALEVIAEALKRNLGDCTWNTAKISSELRRLVNDDVQELSKCAYGQ